MTISERIKAKILKWLGIEKLTNNPDSERLTFINDDDEIKKFEIKANKIWYLGNSNELLNFYTESRINDMPNNPIYNRNIENYFWAKSVDECDIKRVHSGIPNAICMTLSNVIDYPTIDTGNQNANICWKEIEKENSFQNKLTQFARPLTLAVGDGAWKVNFDKSLSKYPLWEFYDAENVEYVIKCGLLVGIIFKSYYKDDKGEDYLFLETRYRRDGNSLIDYELYQLAKDNSIIRVSLDTIDELKDLPTEPLVINGLNKILAVQSKYFYDPLNLKRGKSIYAGKLDMFDTLDEIWSQAAQTNRVSTPIEYFPDDTLDRDKNGLPNEPRTYNRQFIKKPTIPDGDGNVNSTIEVTQPDLNFDKYGMFAKDILDYIFTGVVSPSTLGIDVAKKDNADAQREKEKQTIFTRNSIIMNETNMFKDIVSISLMVYEYMQTGSITLQDYDINVKYNEFANPSFETLITTLGSAWVNGELSTEKYVEMLWGDSLTAEEKAKEVAWLDNNRQQSEQQGMGEELFGNGMGNSMEEQPQTENEFNESEN